MCVSRAPHVAGKLEDVKCVDTRVIRTSVRDASSRDHEVNSMGEVAAKIKIMPAGVETDLEALKGRLEAVIPMGAKLHGFSEEPIAFGLKAIIVVIIVGDIEGGTDKVEEAFAAVDEVESVSVIELGRL
jgi:elongation factor 1-beta